jgi:GTP cyclohydrolase II
VNGSLELRRRVVAAAREMSARGLVFSTVGNVSGRWGGGMVITPTRRHPRELEPADLVHLDLDGRNLSESCVPPSLEWRLHAAIYRARPDVGAVIHTHSPHATARSFDPAPLVVETEERTYFDLDRIEVAPPAPAGSQQLSRAAVWALGSRPAVLLARHGVVGVGSDPGEALDMCCLVEHQAIITGLLKRPPRPATAACPAIRTRVRLPVELDRATSIQADVFTFTGLGDDREHVALGLGRYADVAVPLVRPHSECLTGDVFGSARCDCGPQLRESIERIAAAGGYLLYLRQEGRGIGLYSKLDAYALQENGLDTYEANRALGLPEDARDYQAAAQMLRALAATSVDLLTNNPDKVTQLRAQGITVRAVQTTSAFVTSINARYLHAKTNRHQDTRSASA